MKVGRNRPCPCGSGAKFKRCHGQFGVRRQIIWLRLDRRLAECRPHLGVDVKRRSCGAASADVGWFGV
ncbi:SEC-C domain-containing protein [Mesorhizobium sp. PAMC28654]|uniref:SEC-C metal-binding domain-containing protein n=1 Tax=Mesorhizobium sp. PAMC28654 TaxID=2880934 RepID=UPI001D09F4CC|nr:SEC-C domain-containing protein [Mesorhizobium sp. PAMC28654]